MFSLKVSKNEEQIAFYSLFSVVYDLCFVILSVTFEFSTPAKMLNFLFIEVA